jgi:diguanylate cyclase (GGDEF)-like protein
MPRDIAALPARAHAADGWQDARDVDTSLTPNVLSVAVRGAASAAEAAFDAGNQTAAGLAGAHGALGVITLLTAVMQEHKPGSFVHDLPDGRAAAVVYQPLPDGGWLVTLEDISERRAAEARARHLSRHDALTGLPNRAQLHDRLMEVVSEARRQEEDGRTPPRVAALCLDLDRFTQVNDTLGHPTGDALLRAASERIVANIRSTRVGGDFVARLGGDEFAIVLSRLDRDPDRARADASAVAGRMVATLSEPFLIDGQQVLVGATVGVALYPDDGRSADELIRSVDLALYRAKAEGAAGTGSSSRPWPWKRMTAA